MYGTIVIIMPVTNNIALLLCNASMLYIQLVMTSCIQYFGFRPRRTELVSLTMEICWYYAGNKTFAVGTS